MRNVRVYWLLSAFVAVLGLILFYRTMTTFNQATVIVEWSTATELNTVGFIILRSADPNGPYERINPDLIPASDNLYSGSEYSYEDHNTQRGKTYYYMLQDLEDTGLVNEYGPIAIKATNSSLVTLLLAILMFASSGLLAWQAKAGSARAEALNGRL